MRANHPPPFGLNQVFRTVAAGVASDPQGGSEEVGHVREAAMLGLHPCQRRSHVLLTLFREGGGGGGGDLTEHFNCTELLFSCFLCESIDK